MKYFYRFFVFFLLTSGLILFPGSIAQAQLVTTCENSDFSLGTWKGWNGCYGTYDWPCLNYGFYQVTPN